MNLRCIAAMIAVILFFSGNIRELQAAELPLDITGKDNAIIKLQEENASLLNRLKVLESVPVLTGEALTQKKFLKLQEISRDVKSQRQTMTDFEGFVKWMSGKLSSYSKYVEAGSVAAGFAKILPIPYAGQAGMFTKFISHFALSLNAASVAINRYLGSSQQFVARMDAIGNSPAGKSKEINELSKYADEQLVRDMSDVQAKLTATSDLSSSALSFLESLHQYLGSSDEYWNKTKSLLSRKEIDKNEKSFLTANIEGLKNRAGSFNAKLKFYDETVNRSAPQIKSLAAYDELIRDLEKKALQVKAE